MGAGMFLGILAALSGPASSLLPSQFFTSQLHLRCGSSPCGWTLGLLAPLLPLSMDITQMPT